MNVKEQQTILVLLTNIGLLYTEIVYQFLVKHMNILIDQPVLVWVVTKIVQGKNYRKLTY